MQFQTKGDGNLSTMEFNMHVVIFFSGYIQGNFEKNIFSVHVNKQLGYSKYAAFVNNDLLDIYNFYFQLTF